MIATKTSGLVYLELRPKRLHALRYDAFGDECEYRKFLRDETNGTRRTFAECSKIGGLLDGIEHDIAAPGRCPRLVQLDSHRVAP